MSMEWPVKTLGEIAQVKGGKRVPKGYKVEDIPTSHPYITVSNFTDTGTISTDKLMYISDEVYNQISRYTISADDLYISIAGTIGKTGFIPKELDGANLTENACKLVLTEEVDKKYLYYFTKSEEFTYQASINTRVSAQPKLALSRLKTIVLPVPPIYEQKRIVAILDEAFAGIDAAIANTEKNLANARELFDSYLNSVFGKKGDGWQVKAVKEFASHCLGKMLDKRKNKGTLRPYLRNQNVQWFSVDTSSVLKMKIEEHEEPRYSVQQGDLLVCEGGYPGRAALWTESEPVFFQKALHRVRCEEAIFNEWLLYYLYWADGIGELKQYFTGAGIQHFTGKALGRLQVPLPPKADAEHLVFKFRELREKVQDVEILYQKKLNALIELKQSLLHKAFSGDLTKEVAEKEVDEAVA